MSTDANGNYTLPPSYFVQNGDTVLPVQHNPPLESIAQALTNRLMKDGRTVMTGDLKMGSNKATGLADGSDASDAAAIGQVVRHDAAQSLSDSEKLQARGNIGIVTFNTVAELLADTDLSYSNLSEGDIITAQGFRYEVAASGAADEHVTTAGGVKLYVQVNDNGSFSADAFGCVGDNSTDNSTAAQAAIDAAIELGTSLEFGYGRFVFESQLTVSAGADTTCSLDIKGQGAYYDGTTFVSKVIGASTGLLDAGFLFIVDGMRHAEWRNFHIDYSAWAADTSGNPGAGGILVRSRNQSSFKNTFRHLRLTGGTGITDRELNKTRSIKIVGNEASSTSTGWATYFNEVVDCSFNTAYKHIEMVAGDGGDGMGGGTAEPNANQSRNCLFERYIRAIDLTSIEESQHIGHFFQAAPGVAGINGDITEAVRLNGFGHLVIISGEAGTDSRGVTLGSASQSNMVIIQSNFAGGSYVDNAPVDARNTVIDRGRMFMKAVSTSGLPSSPLAYEEYIVTNPSSGGARPFFWDPLASAWRDYTGSTGL